MEKYLLLSEYWPSLQGQYEDGGKYFSYIQPKRFVSQLLFSQKLKRCLKASQFEQLFCMQ